MDLDDTKTMDLYNTIIQNLNGQGWELYRVLENYETLCSAVATILGGFALTVSLFTSYMPETAGKFTLLNEPLFLVFLAAIMLFIAWISPWFAGKAEKCWAMCSNLHTLGNHMFGYYGHLGFDSKKAADVRIYCQEKICEKYNLNKESPYGSNGLFASYCKGSVGL